jgi:hypothetical protein
VDLPKELAISLLREEHLEATDELLFEATVAWGEKNIGNGTVQDAIADLLPFIRFNEMEQAFLHRHVRQSGLVSQEVIINALLGMVDELRPGSKRALDDDLTAGTGSESDGSEKARPHKKKRRTG